MWRGSTLATLESIRDLKHRLDTRNHREGFYMHSPKFPHDLKIVVLEGVEGVERFYLATLESIRDLKRRLDNLPKLNPRSTRLGYAIVVFDPTGAYKGTWRGAGGESWERFDADKSHIQQWLRMVESHVGR